MVDVGTPKPRTIIIKHERTERVIRDLANALSPWEEHSVDEKDIIAVEIGVVREAFKLLLDTYGVQEGLGL